MNSIDEKIGEAVRAAIGRKVFPGCAIGYIKNGIRQELSFGALTYNEGAAAVKGDTIYDVASVTKAIPTASLLLSYIDEGKASPDDRVADHLPEFDNAPGKRDVRLRHLLTYTLDLAGITRTSALKDLPPETIFDTIIHAPLGAPPGTKFVYTNTTAVITGLVVERIGGESLPDLAEGRVFGPLGMERTTFSPKRLDMDAIAPSEMDPWRGGEVRGVVHDESAYTMSRVHAVGSAGLFSTVPDLLDFFEMILAGGTRGGRRYFSEAIIKEMYTEEIAPIGEHAGLGWELDQPWFMGSADPAHTFGKTGFTGCSVIANIPKQTALVLLSNCDWPRREGRGAINVVRAELADIVLGQ